ncbi:MAG: class I SAM-dependent methyltransferase [Verrucomicrobia bacterium]|nr:class I SAM-dependent methyltransferase [Verrucomicrobiota bacterium]
MPNITQLKGWKAEELREKARKKGDLPYATVERQLQLVDELDSFEFGRFLMSSHGALNGYWTHHLIADDSSGYTGLQDYFYNRAPLVKATRQRFGIFKNILQSELRDGATFASIPCGLMADLLELDFTSISNYRLIGIDIDPISIQEAQKLAKKTKLSPILHEQDAWNIASHEEFDLIASHGLNFYVKSEEHAMRLYQIFFKALKKGGLLVTSFMTPPPGASHRNEWKMEKLSLEDLLIQKIIVVDLLEAPWQNFYSSDQMKAQLARAGFNDIQILYDDAHLMPTICARK